MEAIRLEAVTKTFGETTAVQDLSFCIPVGGLYGFIGPNGAGKTTTIRMLMSILFPDSGALEVLGHGTALEAKDKIGYLPEERGVYKTMRVAAYLKYIARLKGVADAAKGIRHRIGQTGNQTVIVPKPPEPFPAGWICKMALWGYGDLVVFFPDTGINPCPIPEAQMGSHGMLLFAVF